MLDTDGTREGERDAGRSRRRHNTRTLTAVLAVSALALAGCTSDPTGTGAAGAGRTRTAGSADADPATAVLQRPRGGIERLAGDPAEAAVAVSRALFASAPAVVVLADGAAGGETDGDADGDHGAVPGRAADRAVELGVPLLLVATASNVDPHAAVRDEIKRLGAGSVVTFGTPDGGWDGLLDGLGTVETVDGSATAAADLPDARASTAGGADFAVVHREGRAATTYAAALATARSAGAGVHALDSADPRDGADDLAFFADHAKAAVYGVGPGLGSAGDFEALAATAAGGSELPGGGQLVFPGRRMVALYGHPETSALGMLGEQGVDAAITRVKALAAEYQPHSAEPVQPAFEIIATVASAAPGADGNYSRYTDVEVLRPWIEAAGEAGVYVVLDLQPGRNDFLTQAKHYEEFLRLPHVGLAYDPEWRLGPNQRHMVQIGTVDAAELNEVNAWLAGLTREHALPQKVVVLHQFQLRMIADRGSLDTGYPELALVLHADGHGTPGQKLETWNALRRDLPPGIRMAWKNFVDEDSPTFTPVETFTEVTPKPWFVSYQ